MLTTPNPAWKNPNYKERLGSKGRSQELLLGDCWAADAARPPTGASRQPRGVLGAKAGRDLGTPAVRSPCASSLLLSFLWLPLCIRRGANPSAGVCRAHGPGCHSRLREGGRALSADACSKGHRPQHVASRRPQQALVGAAARPGRPCLVGTPLPEDLRGPVCLCRDKGSPHRQRCPPRGQGALRVGSAWCTRAGPSYRAGCGRVAQRGR